MNYRYCDYRYYVYYTEIEWYKCLLSGLRRQNPPASISPLDRTTKAIVLRTLLSKKNGAKTVLLSRTFPLLPMQLVRLKKKKDTRKLHFNLPKKERYKKKSSISYSYPADVIRSVVFNLHSKGRFHYISDCSAHSSRNQESRFQFASACIQPGYTESYLSS
jgi:hypothetical protein